MRSFLAFAFAASMSAQTYVHPVRVQILTNAHDSIGRGAGHGNVFDLNLGERGFDYVFTGCRPFEPSVGDERYSARWKSTQRLALVSEPIGSAESHECTLRTTLRDFVYVEKNGKLSTAPIGGAHAK